MRVSWLALALLLQASLVRGFVARPLRCAGRATRLKMSDDWGALLRDLESPVGGDSIPGYLNALDISRYLEVDALADQPIIVRIGLGLLVVDIIPLAIDLVLFKLIIGLFFNGGKPEDAKLDGNVLTVEGFVKYCDRNPGQISSRSTALLSVFYSDFFNKGFSSGEAPEVLLFQLFTKLGPAFESVAVKLVEERLVRSDSVAKSLEAAVPLPRGEKELLQQLSQSSSGLGVGLGQPKVLSSTALGSIFLSGSFKSSLSAAPRRAVAAVKRTGVDVDEALLDLYIIRRLIQSISIYPVLAGKAQAVLDIVDGIIEQALQLRRIFDPKAGPLASKGSFAAIPFEGVYND